MHFKHSWRIARGILAAHAIFAIIVWFSLPSSIPTHFNATGDADAWSRKTLLSWFAILSISLALQLMIQLLMSPGAKGAWNIPEKERFLKLTPEQQRPIYDLMRQFAGWCALCLSLTMFILHVGMYLAAMGITKGLPWFINIGLFVPALFILLGLIPWSKAVKESILHASTQ